MGRGSERVIPGPGIGALSPLIGAYPPLGDELVGAGPGPAPAFGGVAVGPVVRGSISHRAGAAPGHAPPSLSHHRGPGRPVLTRRPGPTMGLGCGTRGRSAGATRPFGAPRSRGSAGSRCR